MLFKSKDYCYNLTYKEKYNHFEKNLFKFITADLTYLSYSFRIERPIYICSGIFTAGYLCISILKV